MNPAALRGVGLFLALSLSGPGLAAAPDLTLRSRFSIDLEGIPGSPDPVLLRDSEGASLLLEEAAWVFSGEIDGFDFEWTPVNKARAIAEAFSLKSQGLVRSGDRRLVPGSALRERNQLYVWIDFVPDMTDQATMAMNRAASWKSSQGLAAAALTKGWAGRREACVAAIKAGIEAWARSVEPNRPNFIKGRVLLAGVPLISITEGSWRAQVRIRLQVLELRNWDIW
ncbi:MAG: hypothetical protein WCQ50_13945 [Spirochaetota bacterium]